jgi:hypothetical protein
MWKSLGNRLSFANVVSVIALFVALGGSAYAIGRHSVGNAQLRDGSVSTSKLQDHAVTGSKINKSTLGAVPSATNATNAVNATNATHATDANHANHATDATNATNALSASTVSAGGVRAGALGPITTVSASAQVPLHQVGSVYVQCPDGAVVLSGGATTSSIYVTPTLDRKSDPNGWRYDAYNGGPDPADITVLAYCLRA